MKEFGKFQKVIVPALSLHVQGEKNIVHEWLRKSRPSCKTNNNVYALHPIHALLY